MVSVPMVLVICALAIPLLPAERMIERIIDCSCVRVAFLRVSKSLAYWPHADWRQQKPKHTVSLLRAYGHGTP